MLLRDQPLKFIIRLSRRDRSKINLNRLTVLSLRCSYFLLPSRKPTKKSKSGDIKQQLERPKVPEHGPGIWCVIPLLAKLPGTVQARIIKVAGQLMEKMNFFNVYRHVEEEDESDEDSDDDQGN